MLSGVLGLRGCVGIEMVCCSARVLVLRGGVSIERVCGFERVC